MENGRWNKTTAKLNEILADLKRGKFIILIDSEDRENEGDLVCAAEKVTPKAIAFMAKFGRGLICAPISAKRAKELNLEPMAEENTTPLQCNFTVSIDLKRGVGSGISAHDRALTIKALVNPKSKAKDFNRPGHVFPLIGRKGGVLVRSGHTEGSLDLMEMAGFKPAAVICEIMGDDGRMLSGKKLMNFAKKHGIKVFAIQKLIEHKRATEKLIKKEVETDLLTEYGNFRIYAYTTLIDDKEHVALVKGKIEKNSPVLVRVHSECMTGDVFHSADCDCQKQLALSLSKIEKEGTGVLLYMRQEGRGIGLINKLKTYKLQAQGLDTVQANKKLGFKADLREYGIGAQILADIGVGKMRLMTNNPRKIVGLAGYGLSVVERVPMEIAPSNGREFKYLQTKKRKLGHLLSNV